MSKKDKRPNIIEEVFGSSGAGGGAGTFAHNSQTGAKTWAHKSPLHRSTGVGVPTPDELIGITQQEEEEMHHAPPRKPFPLETIQDDLTNAFIQLGQAESKMKSCIKFNTALDALKDKKKTLEFLQKKIVAIRSMIQEMGLEIERINLS